MSYGKAQMNFWANPIENREFGLTGKVPLCTRVNPVLQKMMSGPQRRQLHLLSSPWSELSGDAFPALVLSTLTREDEARQKEATLA